MEVIYQLSETHIKQLHELYESSWWTKDRSLEATKECVNGSQLCIGIVDPNNQLIGFARVITDYIFKALIFDVIVHATHQGKGLGNKLISLVKAHERLKKVKHFELYCLPEMESFYAKHGFSSEVGGIQLMRCSIA